MSKIKIRQLEKRIKDLEKSKTTRLIRPKEACEMLGGIAMSSLYDLMKEPDFPKRVHLSTHRVAFKESELNDWINSKQER